ncbi:MAG: sulfatase-like hydrolase/transferase [Phycisphaerales bacterium]|nr:sulfatase-like hydrolase/transferase [Phycisphaerales bacterium]
MNVLMILTDEQRFDAVGCNGNSIVRTPNLDRLAAEGVNFQGHTCSNPICSPARASLLTGQYSRTHGVTTVGVQMDPASETLATWLSRAGYRCGLFGKSHLEAETTNFNWHDRKHVNYYGFHEAWLSEDNMNGPYLHWIRREHPKWEAEAWLQANEEFQPNGYGMDDQGRLNVVRSTKLPVELTQSAWITRQTERFIRESAKSSQSFFAVCSYVPPHHPFTSPEIYAKQYGASSMPKPRRTVPSYETPIGKLGRYSKVPGLSDQEIQRLTAHYYALCTMLDDQIGQLLKTLNETGVEEETLVIFTSDHGDHLGDYGLIRKSGLLFDDLLRVPLMMRVPGGGKGKSCQGLSQHEDIAPTVLELLGMKVPETVQGRSLAGMMRGDDSLRKYSYFEHPHFGACGVGDGRYKLLRYPTCNSWVLVDTHEDTMELANRLGTGACAGVADRLKESLLTWLTDMPLKEPIRPVSW